MNAPATNRKIRDRADIKALEAATGDRYLPVASTWELLARGRDLYGDRPAFRFLESGVPGRPAVDISHADLFARGDPGGQPVRRSRRRAGRCGRHAGAEHSGGAFRPVGRRGGRARLSGQQSAQYRPYRGIVEAAGAKVLVALGPDPDLDIWSKALEVRDRVSGLNAVLSIGGAQDGAEDFAAAIAGYPADRLTSGRTIGQGDIASCFHTGGTTGAPKTRPPYPRQRTARLLVGVPDARCPAGRCGDQRLPRCSMSPGPWCSAWRCWRAAPASSCRPAWACAIRTSSRAIGSMLRSSVSRFCLRCRQSWRRCSASLSRIPIFPRSAA